MKCIFAISETIEDLASSRASTGHAVRPAPGDGHLSPDSPAMPAGGWILPMNDPTKPDKLLYTPEEARIALGISPRKLWGMTASGEVLRLRLRRLVRYPVDDLRAWINARKPGVRIMDSRFCCIRRAVHLRIPTPYGLADLCDGCYRTLKCAANWFGCPRDRRSTDRCVRRWRTPPALDKMPLPASVKSPPTLAASAFGPAGVNTAAG